MYHWRSLLLAINLQVWIVVENTHHCEQHDHSTAHKHILATEAIDDKVHGNDDADQADNAIDSRCVEAGRRSSESDRLEDSRAGKLESAKCLNVVLDHIIQGQ